jgi:peptide/nickel transport system ATP-binding protein
MTDTMALPMSATPQIDITNLSIVFEGRGTAVHALDSVTLTMRRGERIGVVGESGSGKSTLALAIGGHIRGRGRRASGQVVVAGTDVFEAFPEELRRLRRRRLGFVFQNPIGTLDPTRRISRQFFDAEGRILDQARIGQLLERVGLKGIARVMASYPHELSGGMAQRVAIAMAVEHEPESIIADEPTSALDASIRTQILDLLVEVSERTNSTLVIVTHDLKAVPSYCERVVVMYAGRIVEKGRSSEVFATPRHPYTAALLRAIPGEEGFGGVIRAIPGNPPLFAGRSEACAFAERCGEAFKDCWTRRPESVPVGDGSATCHLVYSSAFSSRAVGH